MTRPVRRVINGDPIRLVPEFADAEPVGSDWEAPLYACFKQTLGLGMTVFDVGASFGLYAIAAARCVGRSGRVVAFEPAGRTAAALRLHLQWNDVADRVEVVEAVVADRTGDEVFWEQETSFVASLVERAAREEAASFGTPVERSSVTAVTLDDFCAARELDPDVVKIDVEGSEARVLQGARALLARRRATLFVEVHDEFAADGRGSADDVFRELAAGGWRWREVHAETATRHYVCTPA
jgi:FkbM family methyltransferase